MRMKVLTIKQPFVDLILSGKKPLEIRTWKTKYRGRLYIHSSKSPNLNGRYCGFILGYIELIDIIKMNKSHEKQAHIEYIHNAYAWILEDPHYINPIPLKGQLGIFGINLKEAVNLL